VTPLRRWLHRECALSPQEPQPTLRASRALRTTSSKPHACAPPYSIAAPGRGWHDRTDAHTWLLSLSPHICRCVPRASPPRFPRSSSHFEAPRTQTPSSSTRTRAPASGWCSTGAHGPPTPTRIQLPPGHATKALGPLRRSRTHAAPPSAVEHACFQADPCRDGREKHERVIGESSERTDTSGALRGVTSTGDHGSGVRITIRSCPVGTPATHKSWWLLGLGVRSTIRPTSSTEPALASRYSTMHRRRQQERERAPAALRGHTTTAFLNATPYDRQRNTLVLPFIFFFSVLLLFSFFYLDLPFLLHVSATDHLDLRGRAPEHTLPRCVVSPPPWPLPCAY